MGVAVNEMITSADGVDRQYLLEKLPATMFFTCKRTNEEVTEWLCMDQNTSADKILRCF